MDLRTGRTYETRDAALAAGVPESDIAELTGERHDHGAPVVRVSNGPFKGRVYRRNDLGQLVRVRGVIA